MKSILTVVVAGLLSFGLMGLNFAQAPSDSTTDKTKTKKKKKKTTGNSTGTGTTSSNPPATTIGRTGASGSTGTTSNTGGFGTTPTPANTSAQAQHNSTPPKPKRPKEMVYVNSDKRIYYRKACPPETETWQTVSLSDAKRSNFKEAKCNLAGR